jgi:hypothetical protein
MECGLMQMPLRKFVKYRAADGGIIGTDMRENEPSLEPGLLAMEVSVDTDVDPVRHFVNGGLDLRQPAAIAPVTILAGEQLPLILPDGASAMLDGVPVDPAAPPVLTEPGAYTLALSGAHCGSATVTVTTLQALKDARWEAAKAFRERRINGGCPTSYGRADSDDVSRNYLLGARELAKEALAAGEATTTGWKMADNTIVPLTPDQVITMAREVGLFVAACQAAGQAIWLAIQAAPDPAALAAIDITAGYPA